MRVQHVGRQSFADECIGPAAAVNFGKFGKGSSPSEFFAAGLRGDPKSTPSNKVPGSAARGGSSGLASRLFKIGEAVCENARANRRDEDSLVVVRMEVGLPALAVRFCEKYRATCLYLPCRYDLHRRLRQWRDGCVSKKPVR